MLNQSESNSDLSTGNIDENPNIQLKPSIQALSLHKHKQPERKNSQNSLQKGQNSNLKLNSRKNSSASKLVKTRSIFSIKNDNKKRPNEEKPKKVFNLKEKQENLSLKKAVDEEKFVPSQKQPTGKRGIQSFLKQLQINSKSIKNKVLSNPRIGKKEPPESTINQNFINKRTSRSPAASKGSPQKVSPFKTPNFAFQPLKLSSTSRERLIKKPLSSRSPDLHSQKISSSPSSEQVLIKKFEAEYTKVANDLDFDNSGLLNYSKFCQVLLKMNFICSNIEKTDEERELLLRAWGLLGGLEHSKVSKRNLCSFLLAVLNVVKKTRASSNDTALSGMKNGTLFINSEDVKRIHRDFNGLYVSRQGFRDRSDPAAGPLAKGGDCASLLGREDGQAEVKIDAESKPELGLKPGFQVEQKKGKPDGPGGPDGPDLLVDCKSEIYRTTAIINDCFGLDSDDHFYSNKMVFKPTLSIPKVAQQKSTSLRSISCSPENFLQRVKFSFHGNSPVSNKKSGNNSVCTSESEGTDNSSINPLVTPPSYASKALHFNDAGYTKLIQLTDRSSKRYKCQSPDSYEESEESVLVTVVLPNEQEQFIRINKEEDLNFVIKDFGRKHNLEINQLITLKQEIMQKLK